MFENLITGWQVGSAVRKLVFQDKRLLLYPVISGIVILIESILVALSFFVSYLSIGANPVVDIIGLFIFYMIVYFTSTYILVAMLLAYKSFASKKPIGIMQSLSSTSEYFMVILEWAVFEAVIVMIIRAIEQRLGTFGSLIFGALISVALSIATMFAIPVIVDKKTGPLSTLKESSAFIVENFGKTFGGLLYSELYSLIFTVLGIIIFAVAFLLAISGTSLLLCLAVGLVGIVVMGFGWMLGYTLSNVYRMVLYDYMNGGELPIGIPKDLIDASVKKKSAGNNVL